MGYSKLVPRALSTFKSKMAAHAVHRKLNWLFTEFKGLTQADTGWKVFRHQLKKCIFIENISGVFPHLERRIYTYILSVAASALAMIDISFRASITNRTRFIENISGVFPHFERRIYTYILSVAASALAMIEIPFRPNITNRTRFIENISGV